MQETQVQSLGKEDPLEKGMATHSSIPAWRIPWAEEPGGPQSMSHKESDTTGQLTLFTDNSTYITDLFSALNELTYVMHWELGLVCE